MKAIGNAGIVTSPAACRSSRMTTLSLLRDRHVGWSACAIALFAIVRGTKGNYRVNLGHGVSRLRSGRRHAVGIIFHDAT